VAEQLELLLGPQLARREARRMEEAPEVVPRLAKWAAAAAETRPGLIPQKIAVRPDASTSGTADLTAGASGTFSLA
jgi:hypothetical protein